MIEGKDPPIPLAIAMRFVECMACELKGERYAWVMNMGRWLGTDISSINAAVHDSARHEQGGLLSDVS